MPTQAKAAVIEEITERFQKSSAAVLTEYRGLTVAQLKELRRSLGEGSSYAVVKNTLTKRAADAVGHSDLAPLLTGPTARTTSWVHLAQFLADPHGTPQVPASDLASEVRDAQSGTLAP